MRNNEHISHVLKELQKIWEENPDLRLGQMLLNAVDQDDIALFFTEDDELISIMKTKIYSNFMKEHKNGEA
jgi:uncharacterized protein YihD (DUF1040 family)